MEQCGRITVDSKFSLERDSVDWRWCAVLVIDPDCELEYEDEGGREYDHKLKTTPISARPRPRVQNIYISALTFRLFMRIPITFEVHRRPIIPTAKVRSRN